MVWQTCFDICDLLYIFYLGGRSIFIRTLLDKKYALPSKVIERLVSYFMSFKDQNEDLPVLWHQSLLVFCQRYKLELDSNDKANILSLIALKHHPQIAEEIERELKNNQASQGMEIA